MLQVGDKFRVTMADDEPRSHVVLDAFNAEFTGDAVLGCVLSGPADRPRLAVNYLWGKLRETVDGQRKRCNIDCMLEQVFAENLV